MVLAGPLPGHAADGSPHQATQPLLELPTPPNTCCNASGYSALYQSKPTIAAARQGCQHLGLHEFCPDIWALVLACGFYPVQVLVVCPLFDDMITVAT